MNQIIVRIQPADMKHAIYIFDENNKQLGVAKVPLDKISETVTHFIGQYSASKITIAGHKEFAQKIKEKIFDTTKYKELEIKVLGV